MHACVYGGAMQAPFGPGGPSGTSASGALACKSSQAPRPGSSTALLDCV